MFIPRTTFFKQCQNSRSERAGIESIGMSLIFHASIGL